MNTISSNGAQRSIFTFSCISQVGFLRWHQLDAHKAFLNQWTERLPGQSPSQCPADWAPAVGLGTNWLLTWKCFRGFWPTFDRTKLIFNGKSADQQNSLHPKQKKVQTGKVRERKRYVSLHNWISPKTKEIRLNGKMRTLTIPSGKSPSPNQGPCAEKIWWGCCCVRLKEPEGVSPVRSRQRPKGVQGLQKSWGILRGGKSTPGQTEDKQQAKYQYLERKRWQCI